MLSRPVESTVMERRVTTEFDVGVCEMNGWRSSMEDAHIIVAQNDWGCFGVLDGHGGSMCSCFCARRLEEKRNPIHLNRNPNLILRRSLKMTVTPPQTRTQNHLFFLSMPKSSQRAYVVARRLPCAVCVCHSVLIHSGRPCVWRKNCRLSFIIGTRTALMNKPFSS